MSFKLKYTNDLHLKNQLTVDGNIIVGGTVDGRNISTDGSILDGHISNTSNPHTVTKSQIGLSEVSNLKQNLAASGAPTGTDDTNSGYSVGSLWVDTTNDKSYICLDSTATVAVWKEISITAHSELSGSGTNTHGQIDTHIADATLHFTEASIDHTNIANIGTNTHAQIDSHIASTSNPHSVTQTQVGLSNVPNLKQKLDATTAPTSSNDSGEGYAVGSTWVDVTNDKLYMCVDATASNAVWNQIDATAAAGDLEYIAGATYQTIQDAHNINHSAGWVSGGDMTVSTSGGAIDVSGGQGMIRISDSSTATNKFFDWSDSYENTIPSNTMRFVGIEYNGGSPQVVVKTTNTWTYTTEFPLGCIVNEAGTIIILEEKHAVGDHTNYSIQRLVGTKHFEKDTMVGGLKLGETGTRNITLSSGSIWSKLRSYSISALDTSASDTFKTYYRDGGGGWTITSNVTQWPNTQYDDSSGTLQTLAGNKYATLWFYLGLNGELNAVYGREEHSNSADAENEVEPSPLPDITHISVLLARLIFKKSDSISTLIQNLFGTTITATSTNNHNNLSNLQGGTTDEYYHLTSTEYTNHGLNTTHRTSNSGVHGVTGSVVGTTDTQTLTNKTLTLPQINDTSSDHQYVVGVSELTADRTVTFPLLTGNDTFVFEAHTQTLTNKSIDADNNTITNIDNADIKAGAAIDATKIADGSVTNTEFQYINTLSSNVQTQITNHLADTTAHGATGAVVGTTNTQTLTNKTLTLPQINDTSSDHQYVFGVDELTADRTITLPLLTGNDTFVFQSHTQTLTNKTINSDNNTITNIVNADIKAAAAIDATKIADGSVNNTEFQYINSLTSNVQTQIDDHTSATAAHGVSTEGAIVGTVDTQTLTNKTWGDDLDMNSNKIINVGTPTADDDAANKAYVDGVASGLDVKDSVVVATTVDLDSNGSISGTITYNNTAGSSSRGQITATLSSSDTFTIDGVTFGAAQDGARILLKDQSTGAQNGIWTTTVSGTSLTLDRATDFDEDDEVTAGAFTFIEQGTVNADCGFVLSTDDPITIGGASGTSLTFTQFNGATSISAGTGLTKSGNTINAIGSATIIANADDLEVNSSATANQILLSSGSVGTAATFGNLPLANTNAVSGILGIANGGTNASSYAAGDRLIATNSGNTALEASSLDITDIITLTDTQTLTNKTLTSPILTTPQFNDTSADHQYILGVSELTADRTVTLPLLTASDEFTFNNHTQTLTNKTLTSPVIATIVNTGTLTLPTSTDTLVGRSTTDTLSNKTLTLPQINDTSSDHQYVFGVSELTADRTVTMPLLTGNDTFVFEAHTQTLTNKSIDADNNTITNIDNADIKSGAAIDASKIADGSVSNAEFQYINSLTSNVQTQINDHLADTATHGVSTMGAIVGTFDTQTLLNKTLTLPQINDTSSDHQYVVSVNELTADRTITLPLLTGNDTFVFEDHAQTLINKSINADNNTITNIDNADIKAGAAIDASKIANGTVSNTEFQYINTLSSNVQTQINNHTGNTSNPHSVTAAQVGNTTAQWNADKFYDKVIATTGPSNRDNWYFDSTADQWKLERLFDIRVTPSVFDDFYGAEISNNWVISTSGGGSDVAIIDGVGGIIQTLSGSVTNNTAELNSSIKNIKLGSYSYVKCRVKLSHTTQNKVEFGAIIDADNVIDFIYDQAGVSGNWTARNSLSATATTTDTGVGGDLNWHLFDIVTTGSDIKFYIDNVLKATHTTNLPTALMKFYIKQTSKSNASRTAELDFVRISSDRDGNSADSGNNYV